MSNNNSTRGTHAVLVATFFLLTLAACSQDARTSTQQGAPQEVPWSPTTLETLNLKKDGSAFLEVQGAFAPSIAVDGATTHLVYYYYDYIRGAHETLEMRYRRFENGAWSEPEVIENWNDSLLSKFYLFHIKSDIAVHAGTVHIAYQRLGYLRHAERIAGAWQVTTRFDGIAYDGYFANVHVDSSGNPHLADHTFGAVDYLRRGAGVWTPQIVDSSNAARYFGEDVGFALDAADQSHFTYSYEGEQVSGANAAVANVVAAYAQHYPNMSPLALQALGNLAATGGVRYATPSESGFTYQDIDARGSVGGSVVALNAQQEPRVLLQTSLEVTAPFVYYAHRVGDAWQLSEQLAAFAFNTDMAIDTASIGSTDNARNAPHMAISSGDIGYIYYNGDEWVTEIVSDGTGEAYHASIAIGDKIWATYYQGFLAAGNLVVAQRALPASASDPQCVADALDIPTLCRERNACPGPYEVIDSCGVPRSYTCDCRLFLPLVEK